MNQVLFSEDVKNVVRSFVEVNAGDETTQQLIFAIGAELLDVSIDKMIEMVNE